MEINIYASSVYECPDTTTLMGTVYPRIVLSKSDGGYSLCGRLSELPAEVASGRRDSPLSVSPSPTSTPFIETDIEDPDTDG